MKKGTITFPKLTTKVVWAGLYGGHYDVIVFFKEKPKPSTEDKSHLDIGVWYDPWDDTDNIVGAMCLQQFYEWFPMIDISEHTQENGRPLSIEIEELIQMELTTMFDEWDTFPKVTFHEDGW